MHHLTDFKLAWLVLWGLVFIGLYVYGGWFIFTTMTQRGARWLAQRRQRKFDEQLARFVQKGLVTQKLADKLDKDFNHPAHGHHAA